MTDIMKNIFKLSVIALASALLFAAGCTEFEEISTDQFNDDGVAFSAFAPNPVYRGGELTIIGSNLDRIKEVQVPGIAPITDFKVTGSGRNCRLTFILPVDGPEVGPLSIVDKDGRTYVSLAELTYTEPVVFTDFSPKNAMPGDVITITGDYMNLIQEVIFADGVIVSGEAVKADGRYTLTVTVPDNAITGRIAIGDSDENANPDVIANKIYSEGELTIGSPTVKNAGAITAKAGSTISITGSYLKMIKSLAFEGASIDASEFASQDNAEITVVLPAAACDGEIKVTDYAGNEYVAATLTCVVPSEAVAEPQPIKAGETLTITGKDLDLVTTVDLPGASGCAFTAESDAKITLVVPAEATEGDITLSTANGSSTTAAYTLVKPTITGVSPLEIYAEEQITVTGTDLDLVTGVTLGGKDVDFALDNNGESILVTTAATSVSGKVALVLANGTSVESEEEVTVNYHSKVIVTSIPAAEHIGQPVSILGTNLKLVENIFIGDTKVTDYAYRTDEQIVFNMPWCKVGSYPVTFHLFDGDDEVQALPIEVQLELNVSTIWEGNEDLGNWGNQPYLGAETGFQTAGAKVGDKVRLYYAPYEGENVYYQIQLYGGHWDGMSIAELGGGQTISPDTVPSYIGYFEFTITAAILAQLINPIGWGGAMLVQGEKAVVTKLVLIQEISQETTIWEGTAYDNWTNTCLGTEDDWVNAGLYDGAEVRIYFTADTPTDYQIQTFDGHWNALEVAPDGTKQFNYSNQPDAIEKGYIHFIATGSTYTSLTTKAWWGNAIILQANGVTFTKVAFI